MSHQGPTHRVYVPNRRSDARIGISEEEGHGASWNESEWAENTEVWYGGKSEMGINQLLQGTSEKEVRRVTGIKLMPVVITLVIC